MTTQPRDELAEEIIQTEDHYVNCPHCEREQVAYCTRLPWRHSAYSSMEKYSRQCEACNKEFVMFIPKFKEGCQ